MGRVKSWLKKVRTEGKFRQLLHQKHLGGGRLQISEDGNYTTSLIDFSSNDYLALTEHPDLVTASISCLEKYGTGAGAARLMSGNPELYDELEKATASLKSTEAAIVFGSGYAANVGVIPALVGRHDVVFSDRLNHASIYDGCRLSGAKMRRFNHNDMTHLEEQLQKHRGKNEALLVVESVYSMDGDICPLEELVYLKNKYSCMLMVDEAHATGVFGCRGGGIIDQSGLTNEIDVAMGTFGKALGSYGAYIACSRELVDYFVNRARSFIFSTGLPPAVLGASIAAVNIVLRQPQMREELHQKADFFRNMLKKSGLQGLGSSQIVPVHIGDSFKAVEVAKELRNKKIFATAVRPPTVPAGTSRIRFSITRHHDEEQLRLAAQALVETLATD